MKHTHNPDYRLEDNEEIKTKINKTRHNNEVADELLCHTNDDLLKKKLIDKNERRRKAVNLMKMKLEDDEE